ncbi:MAG: CRISPR-associated endonuclease Cas2 [Thermodesulfobacteriota bacterium]|nr:CRISPR-associated endonuclease Cas2 [Thermodesulfobacteriota bacterium]
MIYIVCYDIKFNSVDDKKAAKRLHAVSKVLQNYGMRRQRSLFECILDKEGLSRLKKDIASVIDRNQDSVRIYPMCEKCLRKTIVQGVGEIVQVKEYEIL